MFNINNISFYTKKCSNLSEKEIELSSQLFSENYGFYSEKSPKNPGKRIKLGKSYYRNLKGNDNTYVSMAFDKEKLVGQAYYVLQKTTEGYLSWIIQLVVHENYRRKSIGKKLLLSVWGFSDDRAWGLATTNPLTIKTLESSTLRNVSFSAMKKNLNIIKQIGTKVSFINEQKINITNSNATVDTNFFVDHNVLRNLIKQYGRKKWPYGDLEEGKEWIAFIFQGQEINRLTPKQLDNTFEYSEKFLIDAYSRMRIPVQSWAKGTKSDVDFIIKYFNDTKKKIIDFGCGTGRHLTELKARGYNNILGIDFSKRHIDYCKSSNHGFENCFIECDCRKFRTWEKFDYALCVYDVIGSFAKETNNMLIIKRLYEALRKGGIAILSVMNMELTENIATNFTDVYKNPKKLFKLKSSNTMQSTGDIFNPQYFMIDSRTNVIFRKEKFINDGGLSAEYIVRDRRYYMEDIVSQVEKRGFKVIEKRYVRAGNWQNSLKNTDLKAKEILLVLKK